MIDLTDNDAFGGGAFWSTMEWLRDNDPVHRHPFPDGGHFWAVTRYADVVEVYKDSDVFSSRYGMRLDTNPDAVAAVSQRMLIVSDPPEHTQLKRVLNKSVFPDDLDGLVREIVHDLLAEALTAGELDIVDVIKRLPTRVVCALLGVARPDWDWLGSTMNGAFEGPDEEARAGNHAEIFLYFAELVSKRRKNPGTDFISRIATDRRETLDGERELTDEEIIVNCNGVMAGGNETTRYSTAGGLHAFTQNPDQWELLRTGGPAVIPTAVEEILRWSTPGVHVLRTAMRPTRIGDTEIAVGDKVTLWNVSANRDERAFPDAHRFDITRTPNRHLAFGGGRHLCLGAKLARLELAVFLEELVKQVSAVELIGEPTYTASNFTWGTRTLPVRLTPSLVPA
ncbi:MAG TPA: cytochrome P450 [Actinophytocola sp.]|nr:cytochrome P450 [Actinophytocola sp.]